MKAIDAGFRGLSVSALMNTEAVKYRMAQDRKFRAFAERFQDPLLAALCAEHAPRLYEMMAFDRT